MEQPRTSATEEFSGDEAWATGETAPVKQEKSAGSGQKSGKSAPKKKKLSEKARKRRNKHIRRVVGRILLYLFTVIIILVVGLYALLNVVFRGPSQTAGDALTMMLLESSAGKFVPYLYYTDEEVAAIQERNKMVELELETDTSLIVFNKPAESDDPETADGPAEEDDIVVDELRGATYHGWMMIVKDPSRVFLGVCRMRFSGDYAGLRLPDLAKKYDAVAGINGGAFADPNGQGNGGVAVGVTFSEGQATNAYATTDYTMAGFDQNNVLIVGKLSKAQAEERGIRDSAAFGPALVVNGEPAQFSGVGSGLNPRTAIGQRADGAVLMLVVDGRQVNSPGASMADLVEIMVRYGAVNACNLDGGSSSNMYYNGEMLNDGVAITGSRRIPTAFLVR
ncbi:MAG: phosphodiester glycosidase family protein [Clostridia bacterium]|nr:phosphodiester glycosidase family protein [Clostridia bacterium]